MYCNTLLCIAIGSAGWAGAGRSRGCWALDARGARRRAQQAAGQAGMQARGARDRGRKEQQAHGLSARRTGWPGLCTWCTRPVFGLVRLGIFPESNFWRLFVNLVHEHRSSQNFPNFFY